MEEKIYRLSKYMENKGLSDYRVTKDCGLSIGLIGKARSGKTKLGLAAFEKILSNYPDLSRTWLFTGEGEMLNPTTELQESGQPFLTSSGARLRPYYTDIPVSGGDIAQYPDILSQASDGTLYLPELRSAEFFFPVIGCSMRPTVPEGAIVGVAHVDRYETIDPDRIYLIITADNQRMIKHIVHYDSQSETLTLASDNRDYPAFSLPATLIRDIYRVVCTLAVATL